MEMAGSTHDLKFMMTSNVNVSNFVSVKLLGCNNYKIWKAQMLCLIESQLLLHFVDAQHPFPVEKGANMISQYDKLVKGWIFGSVNENVLKDLVDSGSAQEVWVRLESLFNVPVISDTDQGDSSSNAVDAIAPVVSAIREDLKYLLASHVNVSNFVSVKLSGRNNYEIWKNQMLYLIQTQDLLHIIKGEIQIPEDKYDTLVKGWILGTMDEQLLKDSNYTGFIRLRYHLAKDLWEKLDTEFYQINRDSESEGENEDDTSPGFKFSTKSVSDVPEIQDTDSIGLKKELCEAAVEGCWWKAKSILKVNKNAATEAMNTANGNTILHIAVEMGHNYFVEKLLEFLDDKKDVEKQNFKGRTALHIAAMVGNTQAAQLLLQKRIQLLQILDFDEDSPSDIAFENTKINTYAYLLKLAPPSDSDSNNNNAIISAIVTKEYDLAQTLLEKFPECATEEKRILLAITISFPKDLGFIESFIYPSFNNVHQKTIARCSLLFYPDFLDRCVNDILRLLKICNNTCCSWLGKNFMILLVPIVTVYQIYQLICLLIMLLRLPFSMVYFHVWKVLAVIMPPIKNIEKKRKEYKEAKKILSLICNQMGTSNDGYRRSLFEAVRNDIYEVVDEILFTSPAKINCKDDEGYNIIQLAIINRAEKVYNIVCHIIERTKSYREMMDSSMNNIVHLVGRLAPSFVLARTTGAALQLQRELLWREEVKKLLLPFDLRDVNKNKETPAMVFTREHRDLMKEGESWIKTTAESCSITAALIVTIVFAAAITVPGGSNQESGIPVFKKETAFTIFAVSNAFSLFTASTALLLYLSILTARFSENDFLVSLPRRLIFGLLMLFLSTIAMMVAFGAILFLVFCDQRPWMLAPICAFACLPISVIVTIKLPLLVDLIKSTYFPIFEINSPRVGFYGECKWLMMQITVPIQSRAIRLFSLHHGDTSVFFCGDNVELMISSCCHHESTAF